MELIIRILLLLSSCLTFVVFLSRYMGKKTALFKLLVVASVGCFMLGRLYELITQVIRGSIPMTFNVGMLALIGGCMFLFSASYAQMDGLVDDKSTAIRKYRAISFLAPAVILLLCIPVMGSSLELVSKITTAVLLVFTALASYYGLKHLIIPDVAFGIIASIRGYSLAALLLLFCQAVQIVSAQMGYGIIYTVSSVLVALGYPIVVIAMERGSKKWTI